MRLLILTYLATVLAHIGMDAQPLVPQTTAPSGKLMGQVVDANNQQPIEFATVGILSLPDSAMITGGTTDAEGKFSVEQIPLGSYVIQVDFLGYQSQYLENISFDAANLQQNLGVIALKIAAENLQAAEVVGERNLLQMSLDKKVFDVEKSALSQSGTAVDVLRTVPTLDVDMDGNVSLRGSQGVTVLINGKPSALTGANRKAVLDQIPANLIKSVEIITNPSAKYDPDGKAGMINIVLKKNKMEGISGNVSAGIGTLANKYNATAGLNYRNERINLFTTYNFNQYASWNANHSYRENMSDAGSNFMLKREAGKEMTRTHFAKLGMDVYLNDKHSLTMGGSFTPSQYDWKSDIHYDFMDAGEKATASTFRTSDETYPSYTAEANLSYTGEFKQPEQTLSFSATYSRNRSPKGLGLFEQYFYDQNGNVANPVPSRQQFLYNNGNDVVDAQLDYSQPFEKIGAKLELGWNSTLRLVDNTFTAQNQDSATQEYVTDNGLSNRFRYEEQVHAGYFTFGQKIKKFSYQVGLRLEQVFTTSRLVNTNDVFHNNYFNFYPSVHLSYELPKEHQLQLSYSRRVQRPFLEALNPFISYTDPYSIENGNPYLLPELTHSVQLEYMKYWEKGSLTASVYFQHTTNVLRRMYEVMPNGVSRVYYTNFAYNNSYGIELVGSFNPFKWWRMQGNVNVFSLNESGANISADLKNNAVWGFLSGGMTFIIPKGFEAQINCFYRTPLKVVIGKITSMTRLSLGVSKSFLNKALTVSMRLEDPFLWQQFSYQLTDHNTYQTTGNYRWESRILWLTVNYNFGKMDMNTRRRMREGVQNGGGGGKGGF